MRTTCASVPGGTPELTLALERKGDRDAGAEIARLLVALHVHAVTRHIEAARRFQAHAESPLVSRTRAGKL